MTDTDLQEHEDRDESKPSYRTRVKNLIISETKSTIKSSVTWLYRAVMISVVISFLMFALLPKSQKINEGTVAYFSIDRPMSEASVYDARPSWQFLVGSKTLSATSIVAALNKARLDDRIERVVLDLDGMGGTSLGAANRVRAAVALYKDAGKQIDVFATSYDNASYLIASGAENMLMHPMGHFGAGGFTAGTLYYGEALKEYGVEIIAGKAGTYKSAIEPYLRGNMSEASKEAAQSFLGSVLHGYHETIGHEGTAFENWPDGVMEAEVALSRGLISEAIELPAFMQRSFGAYAPIRQGESEALDKDNKDHTPLENISLSGYFSDKKKINQCVIDRKALEIPKKDHGRIGVLTIEGGIAQGYSSQGTAGSATIVSQIEYFIREKDIKALVVRINSPGGDAIASEQIRSELEAFKKTGRPVVISMGSAAASGGYWIASVGTRIFAEPTTLTGSIGVFAMRISASELLNKWGVGYDGITVGRKPYGTDITQPVMTSEPRRIQASVEMIYDQFTSLVTTSRNLEAPSSEWAEGRVWSAQQALDLGLVDEIASMDAALDFVSLDIENVPPSCMAYARAKSNMGSVFSQFLAQAIDTPFEHAVMPHEQSISTLMRMAQDPGVKALCLACEAY